MKPNHPFEFEPHEIGEWIWVWARWRNNANILMSLGWSRWDAEHISATWPKGSDDLLREIDTRFSATYDGFGAIILEHPGCH